ncbi:WD-40 repeat-containing protein [Streptomyces sp. 2323.1]|uniref:WD40 repeat domain-containing protein n=1 Tax=Streptomyces sp. 2323.1 TaxID=1938841 RepID=UPI000BBFFD91|nr:WD40 repeat domain-containing protein [Streptomyces sp. 2323.1]SOE14186.1 WD-40 repeat-containing protein [Streptomyces sp. 2323.1]
MTALHSNGAGTEEARRFLIATAVSRYPNSPELDRRELVDARERVIELFTGELGYQHYTGLGLDPTGTQLTGQLNAFCTSPDRREDDVIVVYLACHGEVLDEGGEYVLLTAESDGDNIAGTSLPAVELARKMLVGTKVRRLMLLLDTCYSGQGGNELAAAALGRIGAKWGQTTGSGLVVVSSAQPHQQAKAGAFPHLLTEAVASQATAGHGPDTLSVSAVVQQMNDHRDRPTYQRIGLALIGLTGEPPAFLPNPRHSTRLTDVDLAVQQAAEFDEQARRRDTEFTTRLLVRAMGYHGDASQGWWFCGRHAALDHLATWLRSPGTGSESTCRVVTAGPGSGKTAVLGLIAALAHPERRRTVPIDSLNLAPQLIPEEGALDVTVYAQNLTDTDVLHALAAAAHVHADTVGELLEALGARQGERPFTVLIDALDEAATPDTLCSQILRPLIDHSDGRIRLLLGTRPHLLDRLGITAKHHSTSEQVVDLDDPRYADPEALQAYTVYNLLDAHRTSPYSRHPEAAAPVAQAVAGAAGTSFLVARIAAGTLAAADDVIADPSDRQWQNSLPRLPGQAMHDDLMHRLGPDAQRAADLLRPLAFAEGQGLPWEDIWAPLASAISARTYTDDDLLWLRDTAGSYAVEATESGRSAYRLYHQALAEHLRDGIDPQAVHAAFTDVLIDRVPYRGDSTRDWSRAHPYTLNYLATHAAAAGRLDETATDTEYLVHAIPRGLTPHLHHARTERARLTAAVYRASISVHGTATAAVRRQVLALDAARAGADSLQQQLADHIPEGNWAPRWATGSNFSPALRDTLTGHEDRVRAVACTSLGSRPVAVTGGDDGTVRVWDLAAGTAVGQPLTGHDGKVLAVACTKLAKTPVAVTGGDDGTVRVWDLVSGTARGRPLTGHDGKVLAVACTYRESAPIAVTGGSDGTVRVWDLASGTPLGDPLPGHRGEVLAVACTHREGAPIAVTGGSDGTVRAWNLPSGTHLGSLRRLGAPTGHAGRVYTVACTNVNGKPVALTGGEDHKVRVWDLASGTSLGKPLTGHDDWVRAVAWSGNSVAVTGSNRTVRLWDLPSRTRIGQPMVGHGDWVNSVACTRLDDTPVAVTGGGEGKGTVRVWDLTAGTPLGNPRTGHDDWVYAVACTSLNNRQVAVTGSSDATVRVWDLTSGTPVGRPMTRHDGTVYAVACTGLNGKQVALTGGEDHKVRVWDLASGTPIGNPLTGHDDWVRAVACASWQGRPLAVSGGQDGTVRGWDLASRTPLGPPMKGHEGWVRAVACASWQGRPVAVTGGGDGTVRLWDLPSGKPIGSPLEGHDGGVFAVACTSLDGMPVAVTGGSDGRVLAWDLLSGKPLDQPLIGHNGPVGAVACTVLNGTPIAVSSGGELDGTVRAWNLRTGEPAGLLAASSPQAVALTTEGDLVLSMGADVAVFGRRPPREPR